MITIIPKTAAKETMVMSRTSPWSVFRRSALRCDGVRDDLVYNKLIRSLNPGGRVIGLEGVFELGAQIDGVTNLILEGQGESSVFRTGVVGQNAISFVNKDRYQVKNLRIDSPGVAKTGGAGIYVSGGLGGKIENVDLADQFMGLQLLDTYLVYVEFVDIRDIVPATGTVIYIEGGSGQHLAHIEADNPLASQPAYGLRIKKADGIWAHDVDFIHCGAGLRIDPGTGDEVKWGFFTSCAFDYGTTNGMVFTEEDGGTVAGLTLVNCWAGSNDGSGVVIASGKGIRFIGLKSVQNTEHGFLFNGGTDNALEASDIIANDRDNTGEHGVAVGGGVSGFSIKNNRIGNIWGLTGFQRYGIIVLGGASDNYIILGNNCRDNITGGILDGGTGVNKEVAHNIS